MEKPHLQISAMMKETSLKNKWFPKFNKTTMKIIQFKKHFGIGKLLMIGKREFKLIQMNKSNFIKISFQK